ncbi:Cysteine-rich RLK (RECEPTOR-like protein kinase) 8 [Theobroma cacao]|uniref:Cysteine-rich RLK (RECEPTOR-like protein kinase) 8 n=1 Tax=Theobroma cacao TaxID=3641 RepID=A0A061ER60_THECC|nr:Cysteine-rich RLK (RECEPTOR-like protein kinase) 8 [Theobroma cacao]
MYSCKVVDLPLNTGNKLNKEDDSGKADGMLYKSMVSSLLYLSATRLDLMFATNLLSRFMQNPSVCHFTVAKSVLRYIKGSIDDSKSTNGFCFSFGNALFCWNIKKQDIVAQSFTKAEYKATAAAANQDIWLRKLLIDLGFKQEKATQINVDNQSAIAIARNPVQHGKTKHIRVKYHAFRESVKEGEIQLANCPIDM